MSRFIDYDKDLKELHNLIVEASMTERISNKKESRLYELMNKIDEKIKLADMQMLE